MRIFVTVGTTPFDLLIEQVDRQLSAKYEVTSQISSGRYQPTGHRYFEFSEEIERYYEAADLVISHGGAGSIFQLLALKKKVLIVPNLQRLDHHQKEIGNYMVNHGYASVCMDLNNLSVDVNDTLEQSFELYAPEPFTGVAKIRSFFGIDDGG